MIFISQKQQQLCLQNKLHHQYKQSPQNYSLNSNTGIFIISLKMIVSQLTEQTKNNEQSLSDENAIESLKQLVTLNNQQLLELTHNHQKFSQKLNELNHQACLHIQKQQFTETLIYLGEAEKVLEYAASCGKSIQRKLIITILNNLAALYQKAWELQKAESYLEAIIYNIYSFFDNDSQQLYRSKPLKFTKNVFDKSSTDYQDFSLALYKKKSLIIFYLQYCAINSQNKNHQRAFFSAQTAVSLIKQTSLDLYKYEKFLRQNTISHQFEQEDKQSPYDQKDLLYQLATLKPIDMKEINFEQFYQKTVKQVAAYLKRIQTLELNAEQKMQIYKKSFQNYSIGTIMQINPIELNQYTDKLNLEDQISIIQKHFKAIYLSISHFILGTEGRFVATEKYSLDENQKKNSPQFQESQIYHLYSIVILTRFLLCESGYFDHIVNSFKNHYKMDILADARYLLENEEKSDEKYSDNHELFEIEKQINPSVGSVQVQLKQNTHSSIKSSQPFQGLKENILNIKPENELKTQQCEKIISSYFIDKKKMTFDEKIIKHLKNPAKSQIIEKSNEQEQEIRFKINKKKKFLDNKSKSKLFSQINQSVSNHQNKNPAKSILAITSRQKQNKEKQSPTKAYPKSSKSKGKSDYLFISSDRKMNLKNHLINDKKTQRTDSKRSKICIKRHSQYTVNTTSRSKNKTIPTSSERSRKLTKRKDSYGGLKKTKNCEEEYGLAVDHLEQKKQIKNSKNNFTINSNHNQKSKRTKQSQEKVLKLTSPQTKIKKLKSPKNINK